MHYSKTIKIVFLFALLLSITACIPVVGAVVAGGSVLNKKDDTNKNNPITSVEQQPQALTSSVEVQGPNVIVATRDSQPTPVPIQPTQIAQPPNQSINSVIHNPDVLIDHGWKVYLVNATSKPSEGKLYFTNNDNYYGFDGCHYFKGKYQVNKNGSFLIKSLIISAQGTADCNNELAKNLFFVDTFEQNNELITLGTQHRPIMRLDPLNKIDADSFIKKANFKKTQKYNKPASKKKPSGTKNAIEKTKRSNQKKRATIH